MNMIGSAVGILIALVVMGFVWWAVKEKLWPLISKYVAEPFQTLIEIVFVFILIVIVIWAIVAMLGLGGIHVPLIGSWVSGTR